MTVPETKEMVVVVAMTGGASITFIPTKSRLTTKTVLPPRLAFGEGDAFDYEPRQTRTTFVAIVDSERSA